LTGFFEGKFRTKISSQVEFQQIVTFRIEFDSLIQQWRRENGEIHASAGKHIAETELVIGEECPGSYSGKYGSIEYLTTVKVSLCFPDRVGYSELVQECPVNVIAQMDITRYLSCYMPVHIERNFHKKFFCFNKLSTKVFINLSRAAFVQGETINIYGQINNEHPKNPVKGGIIGLIMVVRFRCNGNKKFTNTMLSCFTLPMVPQHSIIKFEHYLKIPDNVFPTYSDPDALINVSHHISVMLNECAPIEIPLIIGTAIPAEFTDIQNYDPSLLTNIDNIKIRPPLLTLQRQQQQQHTFWHLINDSQLLPLSQLQSSPLSTPLSSLLFPLPYLDPNCGKHHDKSHLVPLCTPFPTFHSTLNYHSQANFSPRELPATRYKGQSVLMIEEIE
uniref:Arrestin_C domain-containing protein n=1 Tax=Onchocerca flexuosa TaxID=387005 RepID=A0A183H7I3_9BILA